ncbi:succinyldiaminopimelate aminotransferase [Eoetvoesiella caeni]|uniref:Succinyldiaminopimelate aminotransferase n=2 Tax=Eoetvoesiella caeni TaxID=645616 RepID=A0A366HFF4_9BURK|nr:succinyldiaminopimelate aminotransferase [Eoetvoesiella caeni]
MASTLMNPRLGALHPYPFEKLRQLLAQAGTPPPQLPPINLSIGEPKHATPAVVTQAMQNAMGGLSIYPPTRGDAPLRNAVADWIARRYGIARPDPETQVLPALGSREALFAFAQTVVDPRAGSLVVCPNPFYQIYEGAALLAGAQPWFINARADLNFGYDWAAVPADVWRKTSLVFVCSPGNPAGNVMTLDEWKTLFSLADKHDFIIAADECYSEIYFNEQDKPLGAMQAAALLGRSDYSKLMCFSSLSKRSNVPGMRSGFVAGDAALIKQFLLYRTYHGSAISPVVSQASIAAWDDEAHVQENRRMYREKFDAVVPLLSAKLKVQRPEAGFYLWLETPGPDTDFTRELYAKTAVTVLPGSFLARTAHGVNPGANRVRIALVAPKEQCVEAAHRIAHFLS